MTRRGWTLLELVVVLAILALLAAMLVRSVQVARESARRTQCCSNLKNLVLAHHNYHDAHNCFPTEWARGLRPYDKTPSLSPTAATPAEFQCPSSVHQFDVTGAGLTPYGQNIFLVGETIPIITDGTSNTVLHGESADREGAIWVHSPGLTSINCASAHTHGAHYGMADGSVRFLTENISEAVRVYLILPNDGQFTPLP